MNNTDSLANEAQRMLAAATQITSPPWHSFQDANGAWWIHTGKMMGEVAWCTGNGGSKLDTARHTAEFIAAAPRLVTGLIDRERELEVAIIFALQCIDPNHAGARAPGSLVGTPEWSQQAVNRLRKAVGIPKDAPDY